MAHGAAQAAGEEMRMEVILADTRGFCFGVTKAVCEAEKALETFGCGNVYALGPIIHNKQVCQKLEQAGLKVVERLEEVPPDGVVLIRSHGVEPEVMEALRARGIQAVDATCRLVKRAQQVVRQLHEEGYQVVMIGDKDHPEVRGVVGYAPGVIIVDSEQDVDRLIPPYGKLGIVAQTTHAPENVGRLIGYMAGKPFREIKIIGTLCNETSRRQQAAIDLCKKVDVMFVLGGLHSANTRELAGLCRSEGVTTYHLENWEQFEASMVAGKKIAGVTSGASTPEWVVQEFVNGLRSL
jgi:4-hydroxy-3-methylbut-2-enyl diphosphate reductase